MKGHDDIIELLNDVLTAELTRDQSVLRRRQDVPELGVRTAGQTLPRRVHR